MDPKKADADIWMPPEDHLQRPPSAGQAEKYAQAWNDGYKGNSDTLARWGTPFLDDFIHHVQGAKRLGYKGDGITIFEGGAGKGAYHALIMARAGLQVIVNDYAEDVMADIQRIKEGLVPAELLTLLEMLQMAKVLTPNPEQRAFYDRSANMLSIGINKGRDLQSRLTLLPPMDVVEALRTQSPGTIAGLYGSQLIHTITVAQVYEIMEAAKKLRIPIVGFTLKSAKDYRANNPDAIEVGYTRAGRILQDPVDGIQRLFVENSDEFRRIFRDAGYIVFKKDEFTVHRDFDKSHDPKELVGLLASLTGRVEQRVFPVDRYMYGPGQA